MFGDNYYEVHVDTIKNIMDNNGHQTIDLLKLDIEGAEVKVLEQMLNDKIYPKFLCVEFDLFINKKDVNNSTKKVIDRLLEEGYEILVNETMNITFKFK